MTLGVSGMEIRTQVTEYVDERIKALRIQHEAEGYYQNISVLRANTMKFLPNIYEKFQVCYVWRCRDTRKQESDGLR